MKRLTKLVINHEKVMKDEELILLKGGYDPTYCCFCMNGKEILIGGGAQNSTECHDMCVIDLQAPSYMWVC